MSQRFMSTFSVVVIKYVDTEREYRLENSSFVRSSVAFTPSEDQRNIQNCLFYVEMLDINRDFKLQVEFEQGILLRHKLSNRYLSYSDECEEEENDSTYKLELNQHKRFFKVMPCFQYQTKISNKVKFMEDVYLCSEIQGTKVGYVSVKSNRKTVLGMNIKSKLNIQAYYEVEKENLGYMFSQAVWLSHIESKTFMSFKEQPIFELQDLEDDLQAIRGLWLLQSINIEQGGRVHFCEQFRLKNLMTNKYLSVSQEFTVVNKDKRYNVTLQDAPSDHNQFIFQSLTNQETKIEKGAYLIFKHYLSKTFIGTRRQHKNEEVAYHPISMFTQFEDEDLFEMVELGQEEEESVRFVFSIRRQLDSIEATHFSVADISMLAVGEIDELYTNIAKELDKLSRMPNLFEDVQDECIIYIEDFTQHILHYRGILRQISPLKIGDGSEEPTQLERKVVRLQKQVYEILCKICVGNRKSQQKLYQCVDVFIQDVMRNLQAQELLMEIFRNNYSLMCKLPHPILESKGRVGIKKKLSIANSNVLSVPNPHSKNIVHIMLEIVSKCRKGKDYWRNLLKVFEFLEVVLVVNERPIDINQRLQSTELFAMVESQNLVREALFDTIAFRLKVVNQRIRIVHPETSKYVEIEQVKNPQWNAIIEKSFHLMSLLCLNRNFIAKSHIHEYLNSHNKDGLSVIISYLNIPLSKRLSNHLFSLITNLYIDSCPRINRLKPLLLINFVFQHREHSDLPGDSLRQNLLPRQEEHFSSRELKMSNILSIQGSDEPTLSNEELGQYKEQLAEKISLNVCSPDLLHSICMLIQLESYDINQIVDINRLLRTKFKEEVMKKNKVAEHARINGAVLKALVSVFDSVMSSTSPSSLPIPEAMQIFHEIQLYCVELQLKKLTCLLRHKFREPNKDISTLQIEYTLPLPKQTPQIPQYRQMSMRLAKLYPSPEDRMDILHAFIQSKDYLESRSLFTALLTSNYPKQVFFKSLMQSIIITQEEAGVFQSIFKIYKQLKQQVSMSEQWLCSRNNSPQTADAARFIQSVQQLTNYFSQGYVLSNQMDNSRVDNFNPVNINNFNPVNINRQLLIKNVGIHQIILELLQGNYYLLKTTDVNGSIEPSKKHEKVFNVCFNFLTMFCLNCQENKTILNKHWNILTNFTTLPEVKQTLLFIQLLSGTNAKQAKPELIEGIVQKIIRKHQYDPQYVDLLHCLLQINNKLYKPNAEVFCRCLEKESAFRKFLFLDQTSQKVTDERKLRLNGYSSYPLQVPYLYHFKALKIINLIIREYEAQSNMFKTRIKQMLALDYLLNLLIQPDLYSHKGMEPSLNFFLKMEIFQLVYLHLDGSSSLMRIYNNEHVYSLLMFYQNIFVSRPVRIAHRSSLDQVYSTYLQPYKHQVDVYERNQRDHYFKEVKPLLLKLLNMFELLPTRQNNKIYIALLNFLDNIRPEQLNLDNLMKQNSIGMDSIALKWRNFVNADQNKSQEEKDAKRAILDILRHTETQKALAQQQKQFHHILTAVEPQFLRAISNLLNLSIIARKGCADGNDDEIQKLMCTLSQYLMSKNGEREMSKNGEREMSRNGERKMSRNETTCCLMEQGILEMLVEYIASSHFSFNNIGMRHIFYYTLKVFNFMISNDEERVILKRFYKIFSEGQSCSHFFLVLLDAALETTDRLETDSCSSQINSALKEMTLCVQDKNLQIDEQAFLFVGNLCDYQPFTTFLRDQPTQPSVDFLDKIYNTLDFVLSKPVSIAVVDIAEMSIRCLMSLLNGCNKDNQNYLVDNKLPTAIKELLKVESLVDTRSKAELAKRNRLLEEVISFYLSNGINVTNILQSKIKKMDFIHVYLLNRLKYSLLKLLLECTVANDMALSKIKMKLSVEYLKVNMIWVYEDYIASGHTFTKQVLLRENQDWGQLMKQEKVDGLFLLVGFYFYILIELNGKAEDGGEEENNAVNDEEKSKQKIIKKFFRSISENEKKKERERSLENQPFAKQMKDYYQTYYAAHGFFHSKTLTIEASIYGNLCKIYFPKIPLCNKVSPEMIDRFEVEANRISHDQKLKSLFQFEEESYEHVDGVEEYYERLQQKWPLLRKAIGVVQNEENIFLMNCIIAILITIFYLLEDYSKPMIAFETFLYIVPVDPFTYFLSVLIVCNVGLGLLMLLDLLLRKLPLSYELLSSKYENKAEKEDAKWYNLFPLYAACRMTREVSYYLYSILFAFLSIVHPLFAGYQLVYIFFRIAIGRQIVRSIKETYFSLLVAIALLIIFNYLYSMMFYNMISDTTVGYAAICTNLSRCAMFLVDMSLKAGQGFLAYTPDNTSSPSNYLYLSLNFILLAEIIYLLFAQKVIFQIFSGTIIDKFSQLREESQKQQEDEESLCYICAQERFQIDFTLQGFERHIKHTHCKMNYVFYMFYVRKRNQQQYGNYEKFVKECMKKKRTEWVPDQTSLLKQSINSKELKQEEEDPDAIYMKYMQTKTQEVKQLKLKIEALATQLKDQI